eukprot:TRINITY_DN31752_c0_g2_i6.p1 TRINITY_DN31752_c0_g2~~TRINITY_DN31752_c0_g2_i6.p1  ORF type:complete len:271 (-),score=44.85 TRINITY_DN31752_c0_g2_i6:20-832(-)
MSTHIFLKGMPSCPLNFRAKCGGFLWMFQHFMYKRAKRAKESAVRIVELRSMRLSFALVILVATLLHQAGDVEMNPGPGAKNKPTKQTRLDTSVRRESVEASAAGGKGCEKDTGQTEPTLTSLMEVLTGLKQDLTGGLDSVNGRLDYLSDSVFGIREEVSQLSQTVNAVKEENETLKRQNQQLLDRLEASERKLDDLEGRSKRNNLIFNGLKRTAQRESWDDCEKLVKDVIHNQLKIDRNVEFERVHRLGKDPDPPLLLAFQTSRTSRKF